MKSRRRRKSIRFATKAQETRSLVVLRNSLLFGMALRALRRCGGGLGGSRSSREGGDRSYRGTYAGTAPSDSFVAGTIQTKLTR